jgi:hypothetical protein
MIQIDAWTDWLKCSARDSRRAARGAIPDAVEIERAARREVGPVAPGRPNLRRHEPVVDLRQGRVAIAIESRECRLRGLHDGQVADAGLDFDRSVVVRGDAGETGQVACAG